MILWNITITVLLKSQVHCVTYYFVLMHEIFTSQNTETHYTVIIFLYQAHDCWTTGSSKVLSDCQCILHRAIILLSKYHNISEGNCDVLEILLQFFDFSFFLCWTFVTRFLMHKFVDYTALIIIFDFSNKYLIILRIKNLQTSIWYCKALFSVGYFPKC